MVPTDDGKKARSTRGDSATNRPDSPSSLDSSSTSSVAGGVTRQQHGDKTSEAAAAKRTTANEGRPEGGQENASSAGGDEHPEAHDGSHNPAQQQLQQQVQSRSEQDNGSIGRSPGEIAFFKLLHAEFKKATHFFDRAQQEFIIREERVREGMGIMKQPNSIMVNEKWSLLGKSIYRLYKDLLLLETFAIMTYCSFSKILKKHDKVTGYATRNKFMTNVVNKANFTNYPKVLAMISRCEQLYEEVSEHLIREGKDNLYEDERLFINMIHRLNEQVLDTAENEGAERKEVRRTSVQISNMPPRKMEKESRATSSLRSLVEEIDNNNLAAQVSEGHVGEGEGDESDGSKGSAKPPAKRAATETIPKKQATVVKKPRTS